MYDRLLLIISTIFIGIIWSSSANKLDNDSDATEVNGTEHDIFLLNRTDDGCHCANYSCGCCGHIEESVIHLNATVCINATYLHEDYGIILTLTWNNMTIFNETVSARNPPPICVGMPYVEKYVDVCIRLYDLDISRKKFHGCAEAEARLKKIFVRDYKLGCFDIGYFQSLRSNQENINNSYYVPSVTLI